MMNWQKQTSLFKLTGLEESQIKQFGFTCNVTNDYSTPNDAILRSHSQALQLGFIPAGPPSCREKFRLLG